MTTGNIKDLGTFFGANAVNQIAQSQKVQNAGESFSQMMKQTKAQGDENPAVKDAAQAVKTAKARKTAIGDSSEGRLAEAPNENGSAEKKDISEVNDLDRNEPSDNPEAIVYEVVGDASIQAEKVVTELLDITTEELSEVLEALGISSIELLDAETLKQVYAEIKGVEEPAALLTDEELYKGLTEVMETIEDLTEEIKEEYSLSQQQLEEIAAEVKSKQEMNPSPLVSEEVNSKSVVSFAETQKTKVENTVESEITEETVFEEEIPQDTIKYEKRGESSESGREFGQMMNQGEAQDNRVMLSADEPVFENFSYTGRDIDAADIERQIIDQMKVKITEETTSLEMQLNPASLGHVGLTIEAKNGALTASFTAQNEAVKEVIEGQIVQLQENLDKQGIKVEAVEVTVESHAFEQEMDKQNDPKSGEQESQRLQKELMQRRMRINLLNELAGEAEDISEEEALNRDIMERNGNSLDYMA